MKNLTILISLLLASISTPTLASEVGTKYFEVGYARTTYKESGLADFDLGTIKATYGVVVWDNVALEGFLATGVSDDTQSYRGVPIKVSLDSAIGFYARPFMKIGEGAEIFGRVGFAESKVSGSVGATSIRSTGNDFSYGVGAAINISKNAYVVLDYMTYYSKNEIDVTGFGIGVKWSF